MAAAGPNECLQLLALDFRSAVFQALGDNPGYEQWFASCDMVSAYEYHRRVLKLLQWKFPARPWRLKSPAHMQSIDALVQVYPDASFVMTHRDIAQVIPSVVSLLDATSDLLRDGDLPDDFAARQADVLGARAAQRRSRSATAARTTDSSTSASTSSDPTRCRRWVASTTGSAMELTDEVADRMRAWWASNPADKHGRPRVPPRAVRDRPRPAPRAVRVLQRSFRVADT